MPTTVNIPDECWWWPVPSGPVHQDHPAGYRNAWGANVKRDFDWYGPGGPGVLAANSEAAEKAWELRGKKANLDELKAVLGAAAQTQTGDIRQAWQEQRGDIRNVGQMLLDDRLTFRSALAFAHLGQMQDKHNVGLQMAYDNMADARLSRTVSYNLQAIRAMENDMAKKQMDTTVEALQQIENALLEAMRAGYGGSQPVATPTPL